MQKALIQMNLHLHNDPGMDYYEQKYNEQVLKNLRKKAHALGLELVLISQDTQNTPSSLTLTT
jgi:predicted acetyltransferase